MFYRRILFRAKIYIALSVLITVVGIGTLGYIFIADYGFIDAFYMTVITITTVGFKEVRPLDLPSKIFTIFLILMSIGTYGYIISVFTEYISNSNLVKDLKDRKVQRKIEKLKNHVIVCGYGRNGRQAVDRLKSHGKACVVIESKDELVEELEFDESIYTINGDATIDDYLLKAGIENAASLITTLPSDADNLYVVLSARQLNQNCTIVSRASLDESYKKLKIAGATNVIMPDKLGGAHMASLVVTPDIMEFINRLAVDGESADNLEEIFIDDLPLEYQTKSIYELDIRKKTGCNVIGYISPGNEFMINPSPDMKLQPKSKLIVIGKPEEIEKLNKLF